MVRRMSHTSVQKTNKQNCSISSCVTFSQSDKQKKRAQHLRLEIKREQREWQEKKVDRKFLKNGRKGVKKIYIYGGENKVGPGEAHLL